MCHDSKNSRDERTFFVVMPDCPISYDLANDSNNAPWLLKEERKTFGGCRDVVMVVSF